MADDNSDDATETALKQIADLAETHQQPIIPNGDNSETPSDIELPPDQPNPESNDIRAEEPMEEEEDTQTDTIDSQPPAEEEQNAAGETEKSAAVPAPDPDKLTFGSSADGYQYFTDEQNEMFALDESGYWYSRTTTGEFEICTDQPVTSKSFTGVVPIGEDGHPDYPKDASDRPVLPVNEKGEKVFPLGPDGFPLFPFDRETKKPTFPIGDDGQPVFPVNEQGKPLVPIDDMGNPIFPMGPDGQHIFPVGKDGRPTAPYTCQGRAVLPFDEKGKAIVPYKDGKPLIQLASDGITPIDPEVAAQQAAQQRQWSQYCTQYMQYYQQFTHTQQPQMTGHGYAGFDSGYSDTYNAYQNIKTTKRVRPEDIDLPQGPVPKTYEPSRPLGDLGGIGQPYGMTGMGRAGLGEDKKMATKNLLQQQLKSLAKQRKGDEHEGTPKPLPPVPEDRPPRPAHKPLQVNVTPQSVAEIEAEKKEHDSGIAAEIKREVAERRDRGSDSRSRSRSGERDWGRRDYGRRSREERYGDRDREHYDRRRPIYSNQRRNNPYYYNNFGRGRGRGRGFHPQNRYGPYNDRYGDRQGYRDRRHHYDEDPERRRRRHRSSSAESNRSRSRTYSPRPDEEKMNRTKSSSRSPSRPPSEPNKQELMSPDVPREDNAKPTIYGPKMPESAPKSPSPVPEAEVEVLNRDDLAVAWPKATILHTVTVPILQYSCKPEFFESSFLELKHKFDQAGGVRQAFKMIQLQQETNRRDEIEAAEHDLQSPQIQDSSMEVEDQDSGSDSKKWKPLEPQDIKITVKAAESESPPKRSKKRKRDAEFNLELLRDKALASMETAKKLLAEVERREGESDDAVEQEQTEDDEEATEQKKRKLAKKERKQKKKERRKHKEKKQQRKKRRHEPSSESDSEEASSSDEHVSKKKRKRHQKQKRRRDASESSEDDGKKHKHKRHAKKQHKKRKKRKSKSHTRDDSESAPEVQKDEMELEDIDSKSEDGGESTKDTSTSRVRQSSEERSSGEESDAAEQPKLSTKHRVPIPADDNPLLRTSELYEIVPSAPQPVRAPDREPRPGQLSDPRHMQPSKPLAPVPKPSRFDQKPVDDVDIFSKESTQKQSDYELYEDDLFGAPAKPSKPTPADISAEAALLALAQRSQDPETQVLLATLQQKIAAGQSSSSPAAKKSSERSSHSSTRDVSKRWRSSADGDTREVVPPPPPMPRGRSSTSRTEPPPPPPSKKPAAQPSQAPFPSQPQPPGVQLVPVATYHTLPLGTLPPPGLSGHSYQQPAPTKGRRQSYQR